MKSVKAVLLKYSSLLFLCLTTFLTHAAGLPESFTLPPSVKVDDVMFEDFGEAKIPLPKDIDRVLKGKHWHAHMVLNGLSDEVPGKEVWLKIKPALVKGGWTVVHEFDSSPFSATLHYQKTGQDIWASMETGIASEIWVHMVDVTGKSMKLTLKPPAAKPEKLHPIQGDIPYLTPPSGAKRFAGEFNPEPLAFTLPGSEEIQTVGNGVYFRSYHIETLSNLELIQSYKEALTAAGWKVLRADQGIIAHYTRDGRDIWAHLHGANDFNIQVADAGTNDLAAQLKRDCHVPLYGILFDFNKASLKPESDSVLVRARDALKANATLAIEVQGHTDNVGGEAYNQKLSESRAQSVMQWLTANGIPATRLSAQGYGFKKPVAGNDTDQGRAKNRRVELACKK